MAKKIRRRPRRGWLNSKTTRDLGTARMPRPVDFDVPQAPEPVQPYTEEDLEEGEHWRKIRDDAKWAEWLIDMLQRDKSLAHYSSAVEFESRHIETFSKVQEEETLRSLSDETTGWNRSSGIGLADFSSGSRVTLQKQCFHLYYRDPIARNVIRAYTYLTVGRGMEVIFKEAETEASARWEEIAKHNRWEQRYRNIIMMTYLTGEWFVVRYPLMAKGGSPSHTDRATGLVDREAITKELSKLEPTKIKIRSLEPGEIENVVPSTEDREEIVGYETSQAFRTSHEMKSSDGIVVSKAQKIFWAEDISHFRNDALGVFARGRSVLEPVMRALAHRRLFQLDRLTLNAIRTRIPMLYQVPGGARAKLKAKTTMDTRGLPRPGTVWVDGMEAKLTYPSLNLSGQDAGNDYRSILLSIAAGVSLPEFLVTMDAAASNYASALVAASPLGPLIDGMRSLFGEQFADLIEEVVGVRPQIEWPTLALDNMLDAVRANSILYHDGVISIGTYAVRSGIPWEGPEGEKKKIEEYKEENPEEFMADPEPDDSEDDDDDSDDKDKDPSPDPKKRGKRQPPAPTATGPRPSKKA